MATVTYEPGFGGPSEIAHGQTVTITGPGFGTKPTAPPLKWDDASGAADIRDLWVDGWPKGCTDPFNDIQRRGIIRGVQPPHSRTGRYIAGSHAQGDALRGFNVHFWHRFPLTPGMDVYASWWHRADPAWVFSGTSDNNYKCVTYGLSSNPNDTPAQSTPDVHFTGNYGGQTLTSAADTSIKWQVYSSAVLSGNPAAANFYQVTGNALGSVYSSVADAHNPVGGGWAKYELLIRTGNPGFVRIFEDGRMVFTVGGHIDTDAISSRLLSIGGFARQYNQPGNFRYYTDAYLDTSFARVMLLSPGAFEGSIGETAGIADTREIQIPIAWSPTSVQFSANLGAFGATGTAQLIVVDANNTPITVGTLALDDEPPTGDPPTITSYLAAAGVDSAAFNYQITATESPTSFNASGLPTGLGVDVGTGLISGEPTVTGDSIVPLSAANVNGSDEEPLALVVRPVIPAVGTGEKPTQVGAQPDVANPLTADLLVSWLFNEGDNPTPATTLVNGGSGGTAYDVPMDYTATGNYVWVPDGPAFALDVVASATGESPLFPTTPVTTGTTWSFECRYTPQAGGNSSSWLLVTGQTTAGSIGLRVLLAAAGKIDLHYSGALHTPNYTPVFDVEQHVVLSVDNGVGTWYINGVFVGPTMTAIPSFILDRLFTNSAAAHSASFNGIVNHQRLWVGRALTASEAESLFLDPYAMYGTATPTAPVISSSLTAAGNQGEPFVYGIVASPLPDDYDAIGLPAGLVVDQALGIIFGTPTVSGVFPVTIQATNSIGTDQETLTLTIDVEPEPPVITSALEAFGRVGEPFSYQITATGSPTSFDATPLPAGLSVNTLTGLIDGTPTEDGPFSPTISAINADGTDAEVLALSIEPAFTVPVITSPLTAPGTVGQPFIYVLTATGDEVVLEADSLDLPAGLTFDPDLVQIAGTPTVDGVSNVDLSATNPAGADNEVLVITIAPEPVATPEITSPLNVSAQLGQPFTYQITATNDPFEYSATNLPLGLTVNTTTGIIDGTPLETGSFGATISATNGAGEGPPALLTIVISLDEPAIISSLTASTVINQLFSYQIIATFPASIYAATDLPPDLVLNTSTGRISGTVLQPGVYSITISAASVVPDEEAFAVLVLTVTSDEPIPTGPIFIQPYHRPLG